MSKSGLFAGKMTQSAPTNGAITSMQSGYHWFEWADVIPVSGEFGTGVGWAATTDGSTVPAPSSTHPFFGEDYTEFTMSCIFKSSIDPAETQRCTVIGTGNDSQITLQRTGGNYYVHTSLRTYRSGTQTVLRAGNTQLNGIGWTPQDWYCVTMSYSFPLNIITVSVVNLTHGEEIITSNAPPSGAVPMAFENAGPSGAGSDMGYGCIDGTIASEADQPFFGSVSQVLIHNKYSDQLDVDERRKFSGLDGIINVGNGQAIFGETPKIYLPRGYPDDNRGTLVIGEYPTEFHVVEPLERDVNLPPISSG